jgi:hypothetical protein
MRHAIHLLPILLLALGCDLVDDPIQPNTGGTGGPGGITRNVLLEEFTGHRCSTCPAAHQTAQQLDALYGDRMIIVGIHATSTFAAPLSPPAADGRYSTDHRTPVGEALATTFGIDFLPIGLVSRKPFNASLTLASGAWGSATASLIEQPALFDLRFGQLVYDSVTNSVSGVVQVAVLGPVSEDHRLSLYLLEDHVRDWQLNAQATPPDVPDYDHRHVLRASLTGASGIPAVGAGATTGDTLTLHFSSFVLGANWNVAHCSLAAFLHRSSNNEVMQAREQKIQP